jgi:predicted small secreted protein
LRHEARDHVRAAAGCVGDDDADRPDGVVRLLRETVSGRAYKERDGERGWKTDRAGTAPTPDGRGEQMDTTLQRRFSCQTNGVDYMGAPGVRDFSTGASDRVRYDSMLITARDPLFQEGEAMFRILLVSWVFMFVVGCDTMAGFGRDVGRLGDKIEQKAERNK